MLTLNIRNAALFVGLALLLPRELYAYIDPGTGSQILQILIAGVLGGAFAIKCWWQSIKCYLRGKFSGSKTENSQGIDEGKK